MPNKGERYKIKVRYLVLQDDTDTRERGREAWVIGIGKALSVGCVYVTEPHASEYTPEQRDDIIRYISTVECLEVVEIKQSA